MAGALDLSSDVAAAGSALAGLLLVYIGGVSSAYNAFQPMDQPAVRGLYLRRAWVGLGGFVLCLAASGVALAAKQFQWICVAQMSLALLLLGFLAAAATALWTVLDIK